MKCLFLKYAKVMMLPKFPGAGTRDFTNWNYFFIKIPNFKVFRWNFLEWAIHGALSVKWFFPTLNSRLRGYYVSLRKIFFKLISSVEVQEYRINERLDKLLLWIYYWCCKIFSKHINHVHNALVNYYQIKR